MNDKELLQLFSIRSENAILETEKQYKRYMSYIAYNILNSNEDAEECINDALLAVWNNIPPEHPDNLRAYLGRITRNIALNMFDRKTASKRNSEADVSIDEFSECFPDNTPDITNSLAIKNALNVFLATLSKRDRIVFIQRYFYCCSISEIAKNNSLTESNVKTVLHRTRSDLKTHLIKENIL